MKHHAMAALTLQARFPIRVNDQRCTLLSIRSQASPPMYDDKALYCEYGDSHVVVPL